MIRFVLDTNIVIALLKTQASPLSEHVRAYPADEVAVSSIVIFELYYGAFKSARVAHNLARLDRLGFEVLPFERADAEHAGDIRAALQQKGTPIGAYDLLIAGQARARDLTLITNNIREFGRVPGLRSTDWTTE